jgi:hypothetical protein
MKNYSTEQEEVLELRNQIHKLTRIKKLLEEKGASNEGTKQILKTNGG